MFVKKFSYFKVFFIFHFGFGIISIVGIGRSGRGMNIVSICSVGITIIGLFSRH
jgi:hypothetical protein